jgi:mannan endo-1,4-beta-mannosidase
MVSVFHSNPKTGRGYKDTNFSASDFTHLLTPSNPVHTAYLNELDFLAGQLQTLQNAGVVVLYRTLHEMNGNWYWWSMGTTTQYRKLWQMEFNYLTKTKGLHNLLFTWTPSAGIGNYARYYPGAAYVDITGLDLYATINGAPVPRAGGYNELTTQVAPSKPFGLTEYGPLDPTNTGSFTQQDYYQLIVGIKQNMPKTTFWSSHFTKWSMGLANPGGAPSRHSNVGKLLSDPWVVNEGDINFSGGTPPLPPPGMKKREKP